MVYIRPLAEGGVRIYLRGTDEEGVQQRRAEWSEWAESLPKLHVRQDRPETLQEAASLGAREPDSTPEPASETVADSGATEQPREDSTGQNASPDPEDVQDPGQSGTEEQHSSPHDPGRWATVASWDKDPRVAPGKQPAEPIVPQELFSATSQSSNVDEGIVEEPSASDATIPKVLEAESFRLVNKRGEPRAVLGLDEDSPYLHMLGTDERSRVVVRLDPEDDEPTLALRDHEGNLRVYIALSGGEPTVALMDHEGAIRAKLSAGVQASADGVTPSLDFVDENGEVRLKIVQHKGNDPVILLLNEQGDTSVILREQEGRPALGLLDEFGTTRGVFQLNPDGSPTLIIQDERGRTIRRLP